ncbi:MAG: hypothetical protein DCF19_02450 [Pseudanabaena frigida]|uniref:Uncharacterized protein n=1 Tax=Pseudanabaena frigida TaxID=945775 RepID=A0A2W4WQH4_9CYAN|nr:MAG: hypothetical protein DCF19_02450 [Pseudanabaena frigida]
MSKVLINSLIDEINLLLSRPVGSVSRKPSSDTIHQREQLKQLRSHLEGLTDDSHLGNLDKQYQALVMRLQGHNYSEEVRSDNRTDKSKTDKLEILPTPTISPVVSPIVSNLFGAESDLIQENSTMTNGTPEPNSTFVNDRMIAALQQAIQQTLQQVVKESVQISVQQVVSQTLAVERALMVGEISASLNKIVESQQRSQISQELITLNQQKQRLNAEITQLESDRANWMRQFQEFQVSQQESLDRSMRSVNHYLQDQIRDRINDTLQQTMTVTVADTVSQTVAQTLQDNLANLSAVSTSAESPREEEFVNKVQEQTDRFLSHLDEMFSSTFRSLEQDIQDYQTSIEAKLGHMETLEQKGEALISALVERISHQADIGSPISQSEVSNLLPELPDDIPARYLETVAEPIDENLIDALLAGDKFGEAIAPPVVEPFDEPVIEVGHLEVFTPLADLEDSAKSSMYSQVNTLEDESTDNSAASESIDLDVTEIESILGASPDTLFEDAIETTERSESASEPLADFANLGTSIIEDRQSALTARELNPDFDLEAATQIVETFSRRGSEIESSEKNYLEELNPSSEVVTEFGESIDDPELLQWLEESSDRPIPNNIAEVSPDEELMSWLGNEALDMAKLPTQDKPQLPLITNSISDLAVIDTSKINSAASSDLNPDSINEDRDSGIENQIEEFLSQSNSDQASDSEESLILLTSKNIDTSEFPEWEDSLVNELSSDLERLEAGVSADPLVTANLDQFIRNTPYALTNWETNESQTYPTIIEVLAQASNGEQLQEQTPPDLLESPTIVEDSDKLFVDSFADSFGDLPDSLQNQLQLFQSPEQAESAIDFDDSQASPFNTKSSEIPEIFDNPELLFDSNTNIEDQKVKASVPDDMDAIFAEVIAQNAAKYVQETPFETNDELDKLFAASSSITSSNLKPDYLNDISTSIDNLASIDKDDESELDTLLFGFDPTTETNQIFDNLDNIDITTTSTELPSTVDRKTAQEYDTVMQDWGRDDYAGLDVGAETMKEAIPFVETTKAIEELDTILQGFAEPELTNLADSSEVTKFAEMENVPTVLENPNINLTQEDDWSSALEQLEANLVQPVDRNEKTPEVGELSADEFFASLEHNKLNDFADVIEEISSNSLSDQENDNLADFDNLDSSIEDEEEDLLLNEFADAQSNTSNSEWDSLLNDLNSFNFNEPLLDDRREQLGLSSVAPISDTSENVLDIDSLVMESRSIALIPPPPEKESYSLDDTWILGIDFGSTALRASLVNSDTGKVYPLFLDDVDEMKCRLVWSPNNNLDDPISQDIRVLTKRSQNSGLESGEVAISHFKQFLKLGLPYLGVSAWQPIIQWSDTQQVSLRWLIAALKSLLEQIQTRANHAKLPDVGLILLKLSGVVFGYPSHWSDTYILNVREAILKAGLVSQAEQVMAVEQAIAPVVSLVHDRKISQEITLLIDAGAVTTSLCLIKGTETKAIERSKLHVRSFDYAGINISQDIALQLFYPHWQLITNPNRHLCNLDRFSLPEVGASAPQQRSLIQQYLLSSNIGLQMLELADRVKVSFGKDISVDSWNEDLMGQPIVVFRRELENLILQPFIQRLNRELNAILSNAGILGEDVRQVLILGSTMHIPLLSRWLAQKLPNTSIDPLSTSVVATGLAVSPLYPNLHDVARQQYSDYFLLQEICRLNLTQSVNPTQLLQQLQMRGINIKSCRDRILSILQGDLPEGLFPWQEPEHPVILEDPTLSNELFTSRLFELETDGTYQPNITKFQQLRVYLQAIIGNMSQTLNEPLVFPEIKKY